MRDKKGIPLKNTPAYADYRINGDNAWVAIKDNIPQAIVYMSNWGVDMSKLPEWVQAIKKSKYSYLLNVYDTTFVSGVELGKVKEIAIKGGHPRCGVRGGHIRASKILWKAQNILDNERDEQFKQFRLNSREKLSKKGEVVSGFCCNDMFYKKIK